MPNKTKPHYYSESHIVNLAGIRWKDYVLIWGGLTDVWRSFFSETRSNACCEKSAEVEVRNHELIGEGLNRAVQSK